MQVAVIGAGPAGLVAARRAAELGAQTILVTRDALGGMAASDGPVPVRVLAHAARLLREARQLEQYGIAVSQPSVRYSRILERVQQVVDDIQTHEHLRPNLERAGVVIHDNAGTVRFDDEWTLTSDRGLQLRADKVIVCTGGTSRRLPIAGFELTATHTDAWNLTSVPESMLVVGAGATGAQVASVFNAFGTKVQLFEAAPRILMTGDEDVSRVVADAFRASGMVVRESFGKIDRFEKTPHGVRMRFSKESVVDAAEAELVVVAIGWQADTVGLNLPAAGVETTPRGYVAVDEYLRTSTPHIFAAGDVTGRLMLVSHALHDGHAAATNAVQGPTLTLGGETSPIGSFTDPEYAQVGLTEAQARDGHEVIVAKAPYADSVRPVIDGRTIGFCKLIVDRQTHKMLGCHIVGERAVELSQVAAVAVAAGLRVEDFERIPLAFPTYTNVLGRAADLVVHELNQSAWWLPTR
jgi:pyruvate/2-oxoglutarate dehydrogenase complex dihydrolipoamide dehydrogenase (E3) component